MSLRAFGPFLVVVLLVVDQLSKWYVTERMFRPLTDLGDPMRLMDWLVNAPERMPSVTITYLPVFNLSMVWNEGISFGLMSGGGWIALTIMALVISVLFSIWMMRSSQRGEVVALAMIIAGGLGNAYDRIRFGAVADFLQFHWGEWYFPTFNVADAAISLGVAALLIHGLFFAQKER